MTMLKVSFSNVDEQFLRGKVEQGYYTSVSEAIRDAVRKLREAEQNRLVYALEAAEQDILHGRTEPLNKDLFDSLTESGIHSAEKGEPVIRPDVRP